MQGFFITGTDTDVGKTYVTALIARDLVALGYRVGVYKPVASGCRRIDGELVADDAVAVWEAAGRPETLERVCPQRFAAPLAPYLAAEAEGKEIDRDLVREGLEFWRNRSDVVLVEGAGGLLAPFTKEERIIDFAASVGYPLIVVARNALGTINHTLLTLHAARTIAPDLPIAGVILSNPAQSINRIADEAPRKLGLKSRVSENEAGSMAMSASINDSQRPSETDPSRATNGEEIERLGNVKILGEAQFGGGWKEPIEWRKKFPD